MVERRKGKRTELQAKLVIKRLDSEESGEASIEVTDLSRNGLGFYCDEVLNIGAVYESYLTIWTKEVLHVFLRITRIEMSGSTYEYGALFIGMSETDAARIQVYQTVNGEEGS